MFGNIKKIFFTEDSNKLEHPEQANFFDLHYALSEKEIALKKTYNLKYWKPKVGDQIMGVVVEMGISDSLHGDGQQEYLKISENNGGIYIVFVQSVLARQIEEEDVRVHDKVAIKFLGLTKSQQGRTYKNYCLINAKNIKKEVIE
ncbi:MAG: hypothetical protein ABSB95_05790 [Dissulfurispiraceae bacterium]|jgi:hypothetical protein